MLEQVNLTWKQQTKRHWYRYREGDHNTHYFHACTNHRRKKNFIKKLNSEKNEIIVEELEISMAFQYYFSKLFCTSSSSRDDIVRSLHAITPMVIDATNDQLLQHYTKEEVFDALMQMGPMRSPSLYGFGARFLQKHWSLIGEEVSSTILNILQRVRMASSFNYTYIALIPKKCNPLL